MVYCYHLMVFQWEAIALHCFLCTCCLMLDGIVVFAANWELCNVKCELLALGHVLEPSWGVLRRLGDVLEGPKSVKNRSWSSGSMMATGLYSRILEFFYGKVIPSMSVVDRVKGDLSFLKDFGCPRLSKWSQIWIKIDTKTWHQIKTVLSTLTDRFWDKIETKIKHIF